MEYQYKQATASSKIEQYNLIGEVEERVKPLLRWYKATDGGGFQHTDAAVFRPRDSVASMQCRAHSHQNDSKRQIAGAQFGASVDKPAPFLLRTYTMRNHFTVHKPTDAWFSAEAVYDSGHDKLGFNRIANYFCINHPTHADQVIGELVFDDVQDAASLLRHQHQIEFIALSKTQVFRSHRMNHEPRGNLYERPLDYDLYNVMAIRRHPSTNAVARIGLGRIFKDEWHKIHPQASWVNIC